MYSTHHATHIKRPTSGAKVDIKDVLYNQGGILISIGNSLVSVLDAQSRIAKE